MLNSQETLILLQRMLEKHDINKQDENFRLLTDEEKNLIDNLLANYQSKNDLKPTLILKIFLAYLELLNNNNGEINKESIQNIKDIIKSIRFNEIELFLPCKNVEWILLEIGKRLLSISQTNKNAINLVNEILETTTDLFKIVDNDYGLAITNYFLAYKWYLSGNKEKASRLLEMVAHIFKSPVMIIETQYYAALINYPNNLRRSINLLENCLSFANRYPEEVPNLSLSLNELEEIVNKFRREFIIREHTEEDKSYLFKVIDNVIHYFYNKNDLFGLSACYYEAGIIFDKLGYEDTAEEYFVEAAIISSDLQQWKLYSKSLINLVVKFFEKGRISDAEDYLNDLIQVASYLKDEGLHKKVETLLLSLKKLKEIKPTTITSESKIEEYISEIDASSQVISNTYEVQPENSSSFTGNLDQAEELDLLESLETLSKYEPEPVPNTYVESSPIPQEITPEPPSVPIDQTFLTEFKEPINPNTKNEVTISNEGFLVSSETQNEEKTEEVSSFYAVRKGICSVLRNSNFEVFTDYKPVKGSVTVDIVATRGKIRKQKLFIMIAADGEGEIELSLNLLISIFDAAERIIFVNTTNKREPVKKGGVLIIYDIKDFPI